MKYYTSVCSDTLVLSQTLTYASSSPSVQLAILNDTKQFPEPRNGKMK